MSQCDKHDEALAALEGILAQYEEAKKQPLGRTSYIRNDFAKEFGDDCWTYQDEIMAALRSARSSTRPNHFAALEKRGLYMPPGILVRLIKVANCTPREQVYPEDARYLVGVLQELTFSKSLPSETPPSATLPPSLEVVGIFVQRGGRWFEIEDRDMDNEADACFLYREVSAASDDTGAKP